MSDAAQISSNANMDGHTVNAVPEEMSQEQLSQRIATLEQAAKEREMRLAAYERLFFDNPAPALVYEVDSLKVFQANHSALDLYGYSLEEMRGLTMLDLFTADELQERAELAMELRKAANAIGPFIHRGAADRELVVSLISSRFTVGGVEA